MKKMYILIGCFFLIFMCKRVNASELIIAGVFGSEDVYSGQVNYQFYKDGLLKLQSDSEKIDFQPFVLMNLENEYECKITKIEISGKVSYINGFSNLVELQGIILPNSLREIGSMAFDGCIQLKEVDFPESLRKIGDSAFNNCTSLKYVETPYGLTEIGGGAFYGCISLEKAIIHGLKEKPETLHSVYNSIGGYAFGNCHNLKEVFIGEGIMTIGYRCFAFCSNLNKIVVGPSVFEIQNGTFLKCSNLETVYFQGDALKLQMGFEFYEEEAVLYYYGDMFEEHKCIINSDKSITIEGVTTIYPDRNNQYNYHQNTFRLREDGKGIKDYAAFSEEITYNDFVNSGLDLEDFFGVMESCNKEIQKIDINKKKNKIYNIQEPKLSILTSKKVVNAYYPVNNSSWTESKRKYYSSTANWVPYGSVIANKISISSVTGSKRIAAGKKVQLKVKFDPVNTTNQSVRWISKNKKIATVNQKGVVSFKKDSGNKKVTIMAFANDGSNKSASITLKSMKGIVKKITLHGKRKIKAGKSLKLKKKVISTKGANKKLLWKCNYPEYATVSQNGKVKTKKAGKGKKITITAFATDGSGKKKKIKIKLV